MIDLYADDTTVMYGNPNINIIEDKLNEDLNSLQTWLNHNKLILNVDKTVCMLIGTWQRKSSARVQSFNLYLNGKKVTEVTNAKLLGVQVDNFLTWEKHITCLANKISSKLGLLFFVELGAM